MFGLAWLSPTLIGAVVITLMAGAAGAWIDHRFMAGNVANAKLETAAVQSRYDGYRSGIQAQIIKDQQKAATEKAGLDARINELQGQLAEQQRVANAKSQELRKLLASAKPGDMRPIGVVAGAYYERLRNSP